MAKVSKLVYTTFITRVIVDETATEEQIIEASKAKLINQVDNDIHENVEKVIDDTECPADADDLVDDTDTKAWGVFDEFMNRKEWDLPFPKVEDKDNPFLKIKWVTPDVSKGYEHYVSTLPQIGELVEIELLGGQIYDARLTSTKEFVTEIGKSTVNVCDVNKWCKLK